MGRSGRKTLGWPLAFVVECQGCTTPLSLALQIKLKHAEAAPPDTIVSNEQILYLLFF